VEKRSSMSIVMEIWVFSRVFGFTVGAEFG